MFPQGGPGAGLVLLRLSLVASLHWLAPGDTHGWLAVLAVALAAGFLAGVVTPVLCIASLALVLAMACLGGRMTVPASAVLALQSMALLLLGPGAYSVDALLFGRRLIEVKRRD